MGWDYTKNATKNDIVNRRKETGEWERDGKKYRSETLKSRVVGKVLWTIRRFTVDGVAELYIGCDLLENHKGYGWGYKGLSEEEHPYYYSCPLSFLEAVPVKCEEWRAGVREYHAKKSRKLEVGKTYALEGCKIKTVRLTSIKPLRGVGDNRVLYRIKKSLIGNLVEEAVAV